MNSFQYYAFISYKREDEEWAKWLQEKMEYYQIPVSNETRKDIPSYLRPIFRDVTDLKPGLLSDRIKEALDQSQFLIVVCSPHSAQSKWVNEEIERFVETGKASNIVAFIVDGTPYSTNPDNECFPPALKAMKGSQNELLGADVRPISKDYAFVQVVASMLNLNVDHLWNRYLRHEEEEKQRIKKQNDRLFTLQTRYVLEKAKEFLYYDKGKAIRMLLEVMPEDPEHPDRPLIPEAELWLRENMFEYSVLTEINDLGGCNAVNDSIAVFGGYLGPPTSEKHPEEESVRVYDIKTGKKLNEFATYSYHTCFMNSEGLLVAYSKADNICGLRDAVSGACLFPLYEGEQRVSHATFNADNSLLATTAFIIAQNYSEIKIWDIRTGTCIKEFREPDSIRSIRFGLDGKSIITSAYNSIKIWDVETGNNIFVMTCQEDGEHYNYADFMPCKNTIICCSEKFVSEHTRYKLFTYDIESQKIITTFDIPSRISTTFNMPGTLGFIQSIGITDNKVFVSDISGLYVFDLHTGSFLYNFPDVQCVIEQDGLTIKAMDIGETVNPNELKNRVIVLNCQSLKDLIQQAKEKYKDSALTDEERQQYFIE